VPGQVSEAVSVVAELKELASMLDAGLLTRDEFDQMKTRLLGG
jgi:putative oligomerization/nucleic acid binding protein